MLRRKAEIILACFAIFLVSIFICSMFLQINNFDAHTWDIGIYAQGIYNISLEDFNPYVSIRNIKIFNDHFDPIIILFSPFTKLFRPDFALPIIELFFYLASIVYFSQATKDKNQLYRWTVMFYLILNRGIISSLLYPSHPTSWAVLPILIFGVNLKRKNYRNALIALIVLCFFREEYPFIGLSTALWLFFFEKERFKAVMFLIPSIIFLFFIFKLRPILLGEVHGYGNILLKALYHSPIEHFQTAYDMHDLRRIIEIFLPISIIIFFTKKVDLRFVLIASPTLFLRIISGAWLPHYGAPLTAFLCFWIDEKSFNILNKSITLKKIVPVICGLLIIFNLPTLYRKIQYTKKYFSLSQLERRKSIKKCLNILNRTVKSNEFILTHGNLTPPLSVHNVFQHKNYTKKREYSWIIWEHIGGDIKENFLPQTIEEFHRDINEILIEKNYKELCNNKYITLIKFNQPQIYNL